MASGVGPGEKEGDERERGRAQGVEELLLLNRSVSGCVGVCVRVLLARLATAVCLPSFSSSYVSLSFAKNCNYYRAFKQQKKISRDKKFFNERGQTVGSYRYRMGYTTRSKSSRKTITGPSSLNLVAELALGTLGRKSTLKVPT
jgi:hypothetical protein